MPLDPLLGDEQERQDKRGSAPLAVHSSVGVVRERITLAEKDAWGQLMHMLYVEHWIAGNSAGNTAKSALQPPRALCSGDAI